MNKVLRMECFYAVSKNYAVRFYVKRTTSIFSSGYNGAPCLTFLSKRPPEKSIVPGNPNTFPLISTEESKTNCFNQVWEKFCPQQLKLLWKPWVQDSEADLSTGGRETATAPDQATKTCLSCSVLQTVGIAGGPRSRESWGRGCPKLTYPTCSHLSPTLTARGCHGAVFGKTWRSSRDKLTGEKGEQIISI